MEGIERLRVLNAPVDVLTMESAINAACGMAKDHSSTQSIVAMNPEKTFAMKKSGEIRDFIENADLVIPDGIGMVLAAKILYGRRFDRVPGADLMQAICAESGKRGVKIFIYGAKEEVNAGAVEKLRERHPDIEIVGRRNGYVKPEEMDGLIDQINASGADVLFLALGSPKQERWIRENAPRLDVGLCMGVGGTLDTITGTVKRAPVLWQRMRAEWLYRFIRQPSRVWRSRRIFLFGWNVLMAKIFGVKS